MTDFSQVLLVSDFDRTLTDPQSRIPPANLEAIRAFQARGGRFTVGTGRSVPMFRPYQAGIPVNAPLILYNGAAVYDYAAEALTEPLWMPTGRDLLDYLTRTFPELWLEIQGVDAHYLVGDNPLRETFYRDLGVAWRPVSLADAPDRYLKLAIFGDFTETGVAQFFRAHPAEAARFDAISARIARDWPHLTVDRAAPRIIDLQARGANKGAAARTLARRLGRELLVCVGDAMNDAAMLLEADLAFAPGDCAREVRDLGCCTLVRPCAEGTIAGVVEALEAL